MQVLSGYCIRYQRLLFPAAEFYTETYKPGGIIIVVVYKILYLFNQKSN
jgi:hypothetical protein